MKQSVIPSQAGWRVGTEGDRAAGGEGERLRKRERDREREIERERYREGHRAEPATRGFCSQE